jgi:hypothetical protein
VIAPVLDERFVRALARAPQARLVRKLVIEAPGPGGPEALAGLLDASFLPNLRAFRLGPVVGPAEVVEAWRAAVSELVGRMGDVKELHTPWHHA